MRHLVCLAAALALTACGTAASAEPSARRGPSAVPSLEPRSESAVRIYNGTTPRCGFRDLGNVSGRNYRDLQSRAFRMHANAVILDPQRSNAGGVGLSGMAVAFTRADCQQ